MCSGTFAAAWVGQVTSAIPAAYCRMPAMISPLVLSLALATEPALVELFSSEGCSSCPPAETLLRAEAEKDPALLVLEFHVDYWDSLGWRDSFSSASFSERQAGYAARRGGEEVFTPQAIVDGRDAFVGSDSSALHAALKRAHAAPKRLLSLQASGNTLRVSATDAPAGEFWVAVTEAGLETRVERGENRGRTLGHAPVVRLFERLGAVPAGHLERMVTLPIVAGWRRPDLKAVAAVQDPHSGEIVALGSLPLAAVGAKTP
jgi:hypothetical protein